MALKYELLTQSALKALKSGESITEHGIVVTRTKSGDTRYRIQTMVDGERIHRTIGTHSDGVRRETCERELATLRTHAREGRLNLPKGRKLHRSFADAANEYVTRLESTNGRNMKAKRRHIEAVLIPTFGNRQIDQVTTLDVERFVKNRLETIKQATLNRELATLTHLFNRMVEWKWVKRDAIPTIKQGVEARKLIRVLSDADADALMQACVDDHDPRLWLFTAFGLNTPMRHSEILRVRYDQIDFASRRIHIPTAKAGQREQPITPALASILQSKRQTESDQEGWIFPATKRTCKTEHKVSIAKGFRRAVTRAGLDPKFLTPHIMRHTAITRLVQSGVDLVTIQRISGHKTLAMVARYAHVHAPHIDSAMEKLNRP